jgi:hypothetical protein
VDLNLETLKREIEAYLNASEFAVFHSNPGGLESLPMVLWDVERYPDYQMFLEVARKAGVKIILFAATELHADDLDDLEEHIEEAGFTREEQREYRARLRDLRIYEGVTCSIELAFDFDSRLYVYELQPDWYDDFANLEDEILGRLTDDEGDEDSLGGYFSNN